LICSVIRVLLNLVEKKVFCGHISHGGGGVWNTLATLPPQNVRGGG
jgi:hypothetical protein